MDEYLWERIQIFLSRDDFLNLRETSQFHAACEMVWTWLDRGFVATGPRCPTASCYLSGDLQKYLCGDQMKRVSVLIENIS